VSRGTLRGGAHGPQSTVSHRVAFFETDAMKIVHHANFVRYFELARIAWMDEHDRPYREYVALDRHFATTLVEVHYHHSAGFDDRIDITCWLEWARGASLRMAYEIRCRGELAATGATEHAMVDGSGRVTRIPKERRENLRTLAAPKADEAD